MWRATGHDPRDLFVKVALDEAAFGPTGSTAVFAPPMRRNIGGLMVSAPVLPISRSGTDFKYVREYERTFKLQVGTLTNGMCSPALPVELGKLRASGGGKIRLRFTVESVSDIDPSTIIGPP